MVNWIYITPTSGNSGTTQITLTVSPNTDYSARTTNFTVRTRSKNLTEVVTINQAAQTATGQMTFNPSALSYTYEGGTIPFTFTANEDWRLISWPTWIGISGDAGTEGYGSAGQYTWGVTALQNSSQSDLDSTFTFYCGGNYFIVNVHQDAYSEESGSTSGYTGFEIISGGTIYWHAQNANYAKTIEYKINNGNWIPITSSEGDGTPINVNSGDIVQFRGDNDSYIGVYTSGSTSTVYFNHFRGDINTIFDVKGNIMSLIDSTNFSTLTALPSTDTFSRLFMGCRGLRNASELLLPSTTLTSGCYHGMFNGCWSLTTPPQLPATTLADACYQYMFDGCSSLTSAPSLPVTTLAHMCYAGMFWGCTSLTTPPQLPATTLVDACYSSMFYGCTSLTTAPELPATTLVGNCYRNMFSGCTRLNYIKCLATNISAIYCTTDWVANVAPTGTFVKADSMTGWTIDSVDGVPIGWTLINESDESGSTSDYLTFEILSGGTIYWKERHTSGTGETKTIEYSKNGGNWNTITSTTGGTPINVNSGDIVEWRGDNASYCSFFSKNSFSGSTAQFEVYGNIMSLIDSTNFSTLTTLSSAYTFQRLFANCTGLTDASNLLLPATTLAEYCYEDMFARCRSLVNTPSLLPSTTLANYCYREMFGYCSSLVNTPQLPATTLTGVCYAWMFYNCTSLTTAPQLPATTLAGSCYSQMFNGCTSLVNAPQLPATALTDFCYNNMFSNCSSLTTAPELSATTLAESCCGFMFKNCTSLVNAPVLPATTLAESCYNGMFSGCTRLNYIKCLATDISATNCTGDWVDGVASSGTFVKASGTSWARGNSGIPNGWTVQDAS